MIAEAIEILILKADVSRKQVVYSQLRECSELRPQLVAEFLIEAQVPFTLLLIHGMARAQVVFTAIAPAIDAVTGRAGGQVERFKVCAVLVAIVAEFHIRAIGLGKNALSVCAMIVQWATKTVEQFLVQAVADQVVVVTDPLTLDAAQTFDLVEILGRGPSLIADEQVPYLRLRKYV